MVFAESGNYREASQKVKVIKMKLFDDLSPKEKIDHIEKMMQESFVDVRGITCMAEIIDVWDYWVPYLIKRLRELEID